MNQSILGDTLNVNIIWEYISLLVSIVVLQSFMCALLFTVACATGRFGVDCDKKCHCKNVTADCQATNGQCKSGCAQHFTGDTCQGNLLGTFTFRNIFYR